MDASIILEIMQFGVTLVLIPILKYAVKICAEIDVASNDIRNIKQDVQELRSDVRSLERLHMK